tara:strand:- start:3589 stop:5502 length:1914 start_codon:yes stop_codon:yes gene_type:complete
MSNLVEIAKDLEYIPDEQLIELANGSDPRFPPFVVISEIKRRTDMRSRASEPMPKTTVAQEMVQEFAMPSRQGLEGMSQDTTSILPPTVYNRDMPSSMMADGGLVGYASGDEIKFNEFILKKVKKETNKNTTKKEFDNIVLKNIKKESEKFSSGENPDIPYLPRYGENFGNLVKSFFEFIGVELPEPKIFSKFDDIKMNAAKNKERVSKQDGGMMMADGGLVGYASGDEIKFRNAINKLAGAELGPTNPKSLSESMSDLERFRKSQQIGRLINNPDNFLLNKFFRYVPDPQQISNYLLGRRDNFTPDVRRPTDKPKNKKQEGGLTSYQTGNQTALSNTFMYTPSIEGNVPFSEQGLYRLLEERGITSEEEQQKISKILSSGLARFTQPRDIQIAGVLRRSDDFLAQPKVDSPFGRMSDRRSFAGEILEGVSPGPKVPEDFVPPKDNNNKGDEPPIVFGETPPADKPSGLASANPQLELPEPPKPPTAAQRQQELNANVLMTLGSAIGSSATPQELFKNLSGLPQQLMAIKGRQKQEDKDYRADLRANIKDKANYDIALKKLDVSITAARNSKNSDLVKYLGELKDLFTEASTESERTRLMREINNVSDTIFSALVGKSPSSNDTDALNNALTAGTKS